MKYFTEAKTSESSQQHCQLPKCESLDYLTCPRKVPIQNYFSAKIFICLPISKFLLHILQQI